MEKIFCKRGKIIIVGGFQLIYGQYAYDRILIDFVLSKDRLYMISRSRGRYHREAATEIILRRLKQLLS